MIIATFSEPVQTPVDLTATGLSAVATGTTSIIRSRCVRRHCKWYSPGTAVAIIGKFKESMISLDKAQADDALWLIVRWAGRRAVVKLKIVIFIISIIFHCLIDVKNLCVRDLYKTLLCQCNKNKLWEFIVKKIFTYPKPEIELQRHQEIKILEFGL